jgi:phosphoheptose isomerase
MDGLKQYFDGETELISQLDLCRVEQIIEALELVRNTGQRVFVFGNGGSATTASHLACDLGKGTVQPNLPRFRVVCLSDSVSLITAYANDMGCESMFAEPLISLAQGSDLAIALSVSGNSPNVLRAMEVARARPRHNWADRLRRRRARDPCRYPPEHPFDVLRPGRRPAPGGLSRRLRDAEDSARLDARVSPSSLSECQA